MRVIVQDTLKNRQWVGYQGMAGFTVGREQDCNVALGSSRFVSRKHLQVERGEEGWEVKVEDRAGAVSIDGNSVTAGQSSLLKPVSQVRLAEFVLTFLQEELDVGAEADAAVEDLGTLQRELHTTLLRRLDLRSGGAQAMEATPQNLERINSVVDELLHQEFQTRVIGTAQTRDRLLATIFENRLISHLYREYAPSADLQPFVVPGENVALSEAAMDFVLRLVHRLDLDGKVDLRSIDFDDLSNRLREKVPEVIKETPDNIRFYLIARHLKKVMCDMIYGLGPLQDLLDSPAITEIMIVSPELVYVERGGRVLRSNKTFLDDSALLAVIERIVAPLGRRIDRSTPLVDARLPDGSRVNAVIPPLALKGPCLTIRRFPTQRLTADDLVEWGTMTAAARELLEAAVRGRKNILVSGGTGSGKTTLLNVLSSFISDEERIVTIEDAAELQLDQEHVVSLETRPANVEGKGAYTIRDLVRNSLRMRPDRVIVGECRGEEAIDMLQAMNTGHDGSMTTVHANSSEDVVSRVETMCLLAVNAPVSAYRRQIAQAIDLIVFIRRQKDGSRIVTQITEVLDIDRHTGEVFMRDIMALMGTEDGARLAATGTMPTFLEHLVEQNLLDLGRWFGGA